MVHLSLAKFFAVFPFSSKLESRGGDLPKDSSLSKLQVQPLLSSKVSFKKEGHKCHIKLFSRNNFIITQFPMLHIIRIFDFDENIWRVAPMHFCRKIIIQSSHFLQIKDTFSAPTVRKIGNICIYHLVCRFWISRFVYDVWGFDQARKFYWCK